MIKQMRTIEQILSELESHPDFITHAGVFTKENARGAWEEALVEIFDQNVEDYNFDKFWSDNKSKMSECVELGEYYHDLVLVDVVSEYYNL